MGSSSLNYVPLELIGFLYEIKIKLVFFYLVSE